MPNEPSFIPRISERVDMISKMKSSRLSLDWRHEYSLSDLSCCCDRMQEAIPGVFIANKDAQRELIENPAFASYLAKFLPLLPEEPEVKPEPKPTYNYRGYTPHPSTPPPSRRVTLLGRFYDLLPVCRESERGITGYPAESVLDAVSLDKLDTCKRLTLLENYEAAELASDRQRIVEGFENCASLPLELTEEQKSLILEPCTSTRRLFANTPFEDISALLQSAPDLLDILRLFHQCSVEETLGLKDYQVMAQDARAYYEKLLALSNRMNPNALGRFTAFWQKGGCKFEELRRMEHWATEHPDQDWSGLLANYSGYVNLIYGKRFQKIDLSEVSSYQESVLIYAIVNHKKHFIRLVDGNTETFLRLPSSSILFWAQIYCEHLNLNDLSAKDLSDCAHILAGHFRNNTLTPGRRYTFPELKALCKASDREFALYHALSSDSTDYRLRVFRQTLKGNILSHVGDSDITALAVALDRKPLYDWLEQDFGHITGLTPEDAARMLPYLDNLRHLLPSFRNRTDAQLALRHVDQLSQYTSIDRLKEDILEIDTDWKSLSHMMNLNPEFIEAHKDSILNFLCQNGAEVALTYGNYLSDPQQEAFFRVVKAELMGKLSELKYFEGDLQRELDFPLTAPIRTSWRRNLHIRKDGLEVREYDGFFSTMFLGVQPQRTCMSYIDGQYRECLLSAFDSNKKILYATLDGKIVGRAFLRLTKGRLTGEQNQSSGFTFVDLENAAAPRPETPGLREQVTLFLERPYISGVGPEMKDRVRQALVQLAGQKADELDVMLVLSRDYGDSCGSGFVQTRYDIYISKSKAGKQYLDSLDGEATVTQEGSYKANTFLVRKPHPLACACNM